jgi:hypothetical protein
MHTSITIRVKICFNFFKSWPECAKKHISVSPIRVDHCQLSNPFYYTEALCTVLYNLIQEKNATGN